MYKIAWKTIDTDKRGNLDNEFLTLSDAQEIVKKLNWRSTKFYYWVVDTPKQNKENYDTVS